MNGLADVDGFVICTQVYVVAGLLLNRDLHKCTYMPLAWQHPGFLHEKWQVQALLL